MKNYQLKFFVGFLLFLFSCQDREPSSSNDHSPMDNYPEVIKEHINAAFNQRKVLSKYMLNPSKREIIRDRISELSLEYGASNVCHIIEYIDPNDTMILEVSKARCNFYKTFNEALKVSGMSRKEISDARAKVLNSRQIISKEQLNNSTIK